MAVKTAKPPTFSELQAIREARCAPILARARKLITPRLLGDYVVSETFFTLSAVATIHPRDHVVMASVRDRLADSQIQQLAKDERYPKGRRQADVTIVRVINLLNDCLWYHDVDDATLQQAGAK